MSDERMIEVPASLAEEARSFLRKFPLHGNIADGIVRRLAACWVPPEPSEEEVEWYLAAQGWSSTPNNRSGVRHTLVAMRTRGFSGPRPLGEEG